MTTNSEKQGAIDAWLRVPAIIEETIAGLSAEEFDKRSGPDAMSVRETVHHLVEANIVASSMIIAALGASGSTYDWSWLYPNSAWVARMGYATAPIEPALATLKGLCHHISNIVRNREDALQCEITVFDTPGGETYSMTVEQIIRHEAEHAEEHLTQAISR